MDSETKGAGRGLKGISCLMIISFFVFSNSASAQCSGSPQPGASCHGYILCEYDIRNPGAQCSDMSPALVTLLDCMEGYLPERAKVISSVSDSAGMDRCVPGSWSRPPCAHVEHSCHYGGRACVGKSYAVDFKNRVCLQEIRDALAYCGGGRIKTYHSHIHVSIGCENGCNCDCRLEEVKPEEPEFNAVAKVGKTASDVNYKSVTVDIGDVVYFDASDSRGEGRFGWDFDGDGSVDNTEVAPTHTFPAEGTFTVTLTFTGEGDDAGKNDIDTVTVEVVDFKAIAYVGETSTNVNKKSVTIGVGGTAYFDASESIGVGSFGWDFGDGSSGSGESTSHQYATEGTFIVSLTFTGSGSDAGKTDRDTVTVVVEEFVTTTTSPLDEILLYKCSCTGICHGREITAQAVGRGGMSSEGGVEARCCATCREIWAQLCGGYANCREDCESCCSDWCAGIEDESAREQCTAVCVSGCEGYQNVGGLLGLFSTILIILAAVFFAVHAVALIVSFGPYERSEAKRAIKYVIIVLLLMALVVNIVNILYFPFRSPGGVTTTPTCIDCSLITECSSYSMSSGYQDCIYNICGVPGICYVNKHNNCVSCGGSPPSGCGDYGGASCTMNPCGIAGGCMVNMMSGECVEAGSGDGDGDGDGDIVIPDDGIPLVDGDFHDGGTVPGGSDVYVDGGTPVYYKFVCCINDEGHPIQIIGTPYSNSGGARCVVLKRGSPPTVEEIEYMNSVGDTRFDGVNWQQISRNPTVWGWMIPKPAGYEDSYIRCVSAGSTGIMLEVTKPTPKSLWYAAFYSPEDTILGHISISCSTPLSECDGGGDGDGDGDGERPGITLIKGDTYRDFRFRPGEIKLFKFRADSGSSNPTLTVVAAVQSHYSHGDLHVMAKYAGQNWEIGPPTVSDYSSIQKVIAADPWAYKGVHDGVYYYMTRHLVKIMPINYPEQVTDGCWYVWVKNIGDTWLQDCWIYFVF
ncbi:MAG: PKD domain-containing protein [Candidatus Altiarchaeota archaeon]|nr:PKD domain-containing protein [Candidatus Altiarchaeota archaeon]